VQWIVSGYIPITNDNPWIMRLCTACEAYVGCACIMSFFISYMEEVEYYYKRRFRVKDKHLVHTRKVAPLYMKYAKQSKQEKFNIIEDQEQGEQDDSNPAPHQQTANKRPDTLFRALYELFNPYEDALESVHEPMPMWLKFMVDLLRPVEAIKYHSQSCFKSLEPLQYDYVDANYAVNFIFRTLSLAGLLAILIHFFTASSGITMSDT
jgi:hypothetical protein